MNVKRMAAAAAAFVLLLTCLASCTEADQDRRAEEPIQTDEKQIIEMQEISDTSRPEETAKTGDNMIYAHIGERTLAIRPEENSSAEAFAALLADGDISVDMRDYGGFEKVGPLGTTLPTNDQNITTEPGDVILYQGNQITIYYAANTWSFTRLGKVQGITQQELKEVLGDDPTVVFSLK